MLLGDIDHVFISRSSNLVGKTNQSVNPQVWSLIQHDNMFFQNSKGDN